MPRLKAAIPVFILLVVGLWLRLYGRDWDQGHALHPDERFLVMVANDAHLPDSFGQYLDPVTSPLNPYNIKFSFYVYGTLPVTMNKLFVQPFKADNYSDLRLYGRLLSALFDTGTLALVIALATLLGRIGGWSRRTPLVAGGLYAVSVFPIQNAHFFTVDSFLTFFTAATLTLALWNHLEPRWWKSPAAGITAGLALACKVSIIYALPVILLLLWLPYPLRFSFRKDDLLSLLSRSAWTLLFFPCMFIAVRIGDPHIFATSSFFSPVLSPKFIGNLRELSAMNNFGDGIPFPPAVQWMDKPAVWFALRNLAVFGLGVPYALLLAWGLWKATRRERPVFLLIIGWMVCFFLYQSCQTVKTMRYFLFIYPLFATFAAFALVSLYERIRDRNVRWTFGTVAVLAILYWPFCFMQIYTRFHSRVQASYWIHENLRPNAVLAEEHWDDALPLSIPAPMRSFKIEELQIFGGDSPDKWERLDKVIEQADYIIFTSNRGYGSMGPQPTRFPKTSRFYRDLFAGRLDFELINEFSSFPGRDFGFFDTTFDDQWAEEAFTVYDHPKVSIFQRRTPARRGQTPFTSSPAS